MFAFGPPYLPLVCLLVLSFLATCGTFGAIIQAFRVVCPASLRMPMPEEAEPEAWWVCVWAALALPSWVGFVGLNFVLDAIRHGVYG